MPTKGLTALGASLILAAPLASCSAEGSKSDGMTVEAAQYSWTEALLTNAIIEEVAQQNPQLGVSGLSTKQLDPATAWAGAKRGDIDLITAVTAPNQLPMAEDAEATMEIVSETIGGATEGWFVPEYVVAPGGPAEGLTSVTQLNDYRDVFDGKLYDADPGWVTTEMNTKRLEGYGIDYEHVVAGEAAQLAQLKRAYERKEPILVYLYHPHWIFSQYDMVQLEEPNPYQEGCLTTGDGACAMPTFSSNIAVSEELMREVPAFVDFLRNFQIPLQEMERMQKVVDVDGEDADEVAREWVDEHASEIEKWTRTS